MKLLLAIDDSNFSRPAAQAMIANHGVPGVEVRVFHAAELPTLFTAPEIAAQCSVEIIRRSL